MKKRQPLCRKCGSVKVLISNGSLRCSTCRRRRSREYYHRSQRYRKTMRDQYYKRTYGVSLTDLERLLVSQKHRCAICRTHWKECPAPKASRYETVFVQHLYVDHDHMTSAVRGLLCNNCNAAIAFLKEDPNILSSAITYLQKHKGND